MAGEGGGRWRARPSTGTEWRCNVPFNYIPRRYLCYVLPTVGYSTVWKVREGLSKTNCFIVTNLGALPSLLHQVFPPRTKVAMYWANVPRHRPSLRESIVSWKIDVTSSPHYTLYKRLLLYGGMWGHGRSSLGDVKTTRTGRLWYDRRESGNSDSLYCSLSCSRCKGSVLIRSMNTLHCFKIQEKERDPFLSCLRFKRPNNNDNNNNIRELPALLVMSCLYDVWKLLG